MHRDIRCIFFYSAAFRCKCGKFCRHPGCFTHGLRGFIHTIGLILGTGSVNFIHWIMRQWSQRTCLIAGPKNRIRFLS